MAPTPDYSESVQNTDTKYLKEILSISFTYCTILRNINNHYDDDNRYLCPGNVVKVTNMKFAKSIAADFTEWHLEDIIVDLAYFL